MYLMKDENTNHNINSSSLWVTGGTSIFFNFSIFSKFSPARNNISYIYIYNTQTPKYILRIAEYSKSVILPKLRKISH